MSCCAAVHWCRRMLKQLVTALLGALSALVALDASGWCRWGQCGEEPGILVVVVVERKHQQGMQWLRTWIQHRMRRRSRGRSGSAKTLGAAAEKQRIMLTIREEVFHMSHLMVTAAAATGNCCGWDARHTHTRTPIILHRICDMVHNGLPRGSDLFFLLAWPEKNYHLVPSTADSQTRNLSLGAVIYAAICATCTTQRNPQHKQQQHHGSFD